MKTYLPLILMCCLIGFSSCSEELDLADKTPLSSAEFLERLEQPILFQIIQMDEEEEWKSGWVIDSEGNIHEFREDGRLAQNQENMYCPGTFVMESMLNFSDGVVGQVDLDELTSHFKALQEIKDAGQSSLNVDQPSNLAFFGLKTNSSLIAYINNAHNDGNGSTSYEMNTLDYINLKKETSNGSISNSPLAAEIVDWMMLTNEEL